MAEPSPYFIRRTAAPLEDIELMRPAAVEEGLHLWDYWRTVRKHRWLILSLFAGTVLITALKVFTMTPLYTAEGTILIERNSPQILAIRDLLTQSDDSDDSYDYYKTQFAILKSRRLAAMVIRNEALENNRFFIRARRTPGPIGKIWANAASEIGRYFGPAPRAQHYPSEPSVDGVKPALVNVYLYNLEVTPVEGTRLVKIGYTSPDPGLSARIVDGHCLAYIRQGLEQHSDASGEAQRFLDEKLVELKERVEKSEIALNNYRRDKGILALDGKENVVVERLSDLNKELTEAEAERIGLEAQVQLIRKRNYDYLPAVVNNALIQSIKQALNQLEGQYASLSQQFKADYPPLLQLRAQIDANRVQLKQEIQREVSSIESAYAAATAKEGGFRVRFEQQRSLALGFKDASVQYAILQREVDTNKQLYDSVLQRVKEMGVAAAARVSNVSIIDRGEPPGAPSSPRVGASLLRAGLGGLGAGLILAFLFEYLDNTLKNPEEVERYLALPTLGVVPGFSTAEGRDDPPQRPSTSPPKVIKRASYSKELILSQANFSLAAEAYRTLRTAILLSRAAGPPKTALFTSATDSEGKTVTTLNSAVVFAQMGVRVLVIDADLRRPRCHKILRIDNHLGLTEVLIGQRKPEEVIRPTSVSQLFVMSSGSMPPNPTELLGSRKMRETLDDLKEQFDHVLVDCTPVMPVSDSLLVATMVDGVVMVVDGQRTPKHLVKAACARLHYARAKIFGVVINQVDLKSPDFAYYNRYGYAYSQYRYVYSEDGEAEKELN